jgi:signal transduction histidine kinase
MLDIDGIASGALVMERMPLDLRRVVEQACVGSEGLARTGGVALNCAPGEAPAVVQGDEDRLVQVVTNLLSNAVRAAPAGSAVEIGLSVEDGRAILAVEDRGAGVPAAFHGRIFGRFERATSHDGAIGTGLGLAISREIVERHGGTLWFEDRAGGGTRFAFALPIAFIPAGNDDRPAVQPVLASIAQP